MDQDKIKNIAIWVCVITVLVIGYMTYNNITVFSTTRGYRDDKIHQLAKIKSEVAEIERLMVFYKKEKSDFQQYLFQEKDIPGFLDGLSGFAQSAGINIVDVKTNKFQEVKIPDSLQEGTSQMIKNAQNSSDKTPLTTAELNKMLTLSAMPINIKISGSYESIVNFYRHLENFKQLISISNIEIAALNNAYPLLQCDFTLKIYSLKTLEELQQN